MPTCLVYTGMKEFKDWAASLDEAGGTPVTPPGKFARTLQNIGHRIFNPTQGNIDWATIDKQRQAEAQRNDPAVRKQKQNLLHAAFRQALLGKVKFNGRDDNAVDEALNKIAASFTLGYQVPTSEVHAILLAIHRAKRVPPEVKLELFPDQYRLIAFLRQVFDHHPETWYNQDGGPKDRFPPHFNVSEPELDTYYTAWRKSPFNFKNVQRKAAASPSAPPAKPEGTVVDRVIEMMKDRANMPYSALEAMADALYQSAIQSGIPVEYGDKQKLRDAANGGVD